MGDHESVSNSIHVGVFPRGSADAKAGTRIASNEHTEDNDERRME